MKNSTHFATIVTCGISAMTIAGISSSYMRHLWLNSRLTKKYRAKSGNRIAYRIDNAVNPKSKALIVLESGHQASHHYWHWIREALTKEYDVLSYDRAGYGSSDYNSKNSFSLKESVDDLDDLLSAVRNGRDVIMIGHSLGGLLAHQSAARSDYIRQLILLDPTHPQELDMIPGRAEGAKVLDRSHAWMSPSLRLGMGFMLDIPGWVNQYPTNVAKILRSEMRDFGLWETTIREWRSIHQLFRMPQALTSIPIPISVIAAQATVDSTPLQEGLFSDYIASGTHGNLVTIPEQDHISMIAEEESAALIGELILEKVGHRGSLA